MRKAITLIIVVFYLITVQVLFAQNLTQNSSAASAGSSSLQTKKEIPNYMENGKKSSRKLADRQDSKLDYTSIANTCRYIGMSNGAINIEKYENEFIEDNTNLGFPIGWITDCKDQILKTDNNGAVCLVLNDQEVKYLGRLVKITQHLDNNMLVTYSSQKKVCLEIISLTKNNKKISSDILSLESGNSQELDICLDISNETSSLLVKFLNPADNEFILSSFDIVN
jgi:hypothetical protein